MQSRVQPNPVGRDVQNVVSEAQELLKTVKDEGANQLDNVKSKVQAQYDAARGKLGEIQSTVSEGARVAATNANAHVRANPWQYIGIAAAVGLLVGFVAARR